MVNIDSTRTVDATGMVTGINVFKALLILMNFDDIACLIRLKTGYSTFCFITLMTLCDPR